MQRERLREFDITDAEHARLRGPVGLNIGSRTQPEIAISILAEMTAWKNGVGRPDAVRVEVAKQAAASTGCGTASTRARITRSSGSRRPGLGMLL